MTYTASTNEPTHTLVNAVGCDSVVTLHLTINPTKRDSVYYVIPFDTSLFTHTEVCGDHAIGELNESLHSFHTPLSYRDNNSCSQQIFTSDELGDRGEIDTIYFHYAGSGTTNRLDHGRIYLRNTPKSSFTHNYDWESLSNMTLVYEGSLNCTNGWNAFALDHAFEYNGSDNLLVTVIDEADGYITAESHFYYTNTSDTLCLYYHNDATKWSTSVAGNLAKFRSNIRFHICSHYYSFEHDGRNYSVNQPGIHPVSDTASCSNNCDSIMVYNLIAVEPHRDTICDKSFDASAQTWTDNVDGYFWTWNGVNHYISGKTVDSLGYYEFHGDKAYGSKTVDTVTYFKLTVSKATDSIETVTACDSFQWHGVTYTESSNTPTWVTTNAAGCDSVVTLSLTVKYTTAGDTTAFACNSFTWYDSTYTETPGVAPTHTFTNVSGCDSVVTLHLTVGHSNTGDTTAFACNSFTWYGQTFDVTPAVAPTHTFTNASGCDSVVTLHLTIGHSNTGDTTAFACNSFTWYDSTYTETPGVAPTHTFTNVSGCDSVVTLHLTRRSQQHQGHHRLRLQQLHLVWSDVR